MMASNLMFRMLQVPLFAFLLSLCLVFPTAHGWRNITDITNAYQGIYWWTALVECPAERFDILVESTRMMLELTKRTTKPMDTPGWQRFFAADPLGVEGWASEKHKAHYLQVHNVMTQANMFPRLGRSAKIIGMETIKLDIAAPLSSGRIIENTNAGVEMFFCDGFFRHKYLNDITNGEKKRVESLPDLVSYEHLLAHEWTHVDLLGSSIQFMDLERAFGAQWASVLAWYGPSLPRINVKYNADNYAWFWTNNWFNEKWDWKDNGFDPKYAPENTTNALGGPENISGPGLGIMNPEKNQTTEQKNCHAAANDPREVFCDYLGEPYSDWLKDREKPFTSEGGCELTKQCWSSFGDYAIDPGCVCKCDGEKTPLSDPKCAGFRGGPPGSHSHA
ncbi:hypothetical protein G4B84_004292 [Aspergillus flavus NRRL3357]|nr:uncharacterized protein G4B84_004292 [Aspergillus flavus NRRL3357]QMW28957.1 hypothetical protein G4B84_004292 [Aspergillus flavus NRRL3357]QMW41032.1 hypothetical protein G4B11_004356 [Aspergillus flavus]